MGCLTPDPLAPFQGGRTADGSTATILDPSSDWVVARILACECEPTHGLYDTSLVFWEPNLCAATPSALQPSSQHATGLRRSGLGFQDEGFRLPIQGLGFSAQGSDSCDLPRETCSCSSRGASNVPSASTVSSFHGLVVPAESDSTRAWSM